MKQPPTTAGMIDEFFAHQPIAFVGVSRSGKKFGDTVFTTLRSLSYEVLPVHPDIGMIGKDRCYADFAALPPDVGSVYICSRPSKSMDALQEANSLGIKHAWLQPGAESNDSITYAAAHGMNTVVGECILMHAKGTGSMHAIHRWVRTILGAMPK